MDCNTFLELLKKLEVTNINISGSLNLKSTSCLDNIDNKKFKFFRKNVNDEIIGDYVPIVNICNNDIIEHFPTVRYGSNFPGHYEKL